MKKGLGLKGNKLWKYIAISMGRAAMVTLLAFLLSFLIIEPMSLSTLSIFSAPEKNDFSVTDLYAQVADRRPVRTLDPDIVLVDIGHADRNEIASILQRVNFWNPRVVGIDVMFASPGDSDSLLLKALGETGCLVIPLELANAGKDAFKVKCAPFFYNDKAIKATYAASNLPSEFEGATIREFVTTFPLSAGGEVESFPMALAGAYNPECIKALRSRKNHLEPIDYPSREFLTLTPDDIDLNGDQLTGRLVILGALSDADDMHSTPINSYMSGLSIQGAATATILSGRFYDPASRLPAWLPACLLCRAGEDCLKILFAARYPIAWRPFSLYTKYPRTLPPGKYMASGAAICFEALGLRSQVQKEADLLSV